MPVIDRWIVDNPPSRRYPIYTRANVGEVFPDPVTPLSATIGITENGEPGWRDAWERLGAFDRDEFDPDNNEVIAIFGGYCYLNVSISRIFGVRTPGLTPEMIDYTFFGAHPGVPPFEPAATDDSPAHTEKLGATIGWILTTPDLNELLEDQRALEQLRAERPDLTALTNDELVARLRWIFGTWFRKLFGTHIFITYAATVPVGIIQQVTIELGDPTMLMRLIAGVGDVDSAIPSLRLWDLGRIVAGSSALTAAFDSGIEGLGDRIGALAAEGDGGARSFHDDFAEFVRVHGSRGPNEWEMRSPSWETEPDLALAAIDRMRLCPSSDAPASHQASLSSDREVLGPELLSKLESNPEAHGQFGAALRAAQLFLAGRERSKTNAIKMVHEARVAMNELGRRMVDAGHFDHVGAYAMLRNEELDAFLADPGGWADEIRQREAGASELAGLEPPFIFNGEPPPVSDWSSRSDTTTDQANAGDVLAGVPGCPGKARGRARVLLDSHDPTALEPGDVLVAPLTDPSWTPLFVPAAGVVVDVGAPLSHAIIVSRELGIPCVVSVTDATKKIRDGAMVEVDGNLGTVTVLS